MHDDDQQLGVLHVAQPTTEGVARCVLDAVSDQLTRGWRVGVACPSGGWLAPDCERRGAQVLRWEAGRAVGARVPIEVAGLRRAIDAFAPDAVHLHSSKAGLAGRLVLRGRHPTVFQPHGWSFLIGGAQLRAAARAWERVAARWSETIVCVSEAERARGEAARVCAPWAVVPNAVDIDAFRPADVQERRALRAHLGVGDGPFVVCVGRLCEQKGQDVLLSAWPEVLTRVPDARLALIGQGPNEARLRAQAPAEVVFTGARDDVRDWLAAADVVAQPSRWEGFSYVTLEALACGTSVVASDVDGVAEALGSRPDATGEIVAPDDPAALARALVDRLSDPELARLEGQRGRRRATERYDRRRWGSGLAAATRSAVGRARGGSA